ncbi:MAG: hypothetical protein WBG41_17155 [Acidimicrobiales bacterium]
MINVMTVHWQSAKWIDVQAQYLRRNIATPYRVFASLNGIDDSALRERFHFSADLQGTHEEKLNEMAQIAIEESAPSDVLMFLDGDAFPVAPLGEWIPEVLDAYPLVAVRRDENLGDPQPHPCFCITTAGFWQELGGDWRRGGRWVNTAGQECQDVGGRLLHQLEQKDIEWLPLLRSNNHSWHPVFFGVYDHRVYHHGAGFRVMDNRAENALDAYRPRSDRPSLGMLRVAVEKNPRKLLQLRPRQLLVAIDAVRMIIPQQIRKLKRKRMLRFEQRLLARMKTDPEFYRDLDSSKQPRQRHVAGATPSK